MEKLAVRASRLSFTYAGSSRFSLDEVSIEVPKGARFGLLGPNGAGKTTLMNMLTGLLIPNTGNIYFEDQAFNGRNRKVQRLFGYIPQDFSFYPELSPKQNLHFFGAWAGLGKDRIKSRSTELLSLLGLTEVSDKPLQHFSGGMKRRMNLAIGVIADPPILFLDEPTAGVDVQSAHAILAYLKELNEAGTTLIYTSHQLSEAEELCDQLALLDRGNIIARGDLATLLSENNSANLQELFLGLTGAHYRD